MRTIFSQIKDILHIFRLRVNMIFRSPAVIVAFVISVLITIAVVNSFLDEADESTSIPIGVIDKDCTDKSNELIDNLNSMKSLRVYEGSYDELCRKMSEGDIYVIVQVNENFKENLKQENNNKLLTLYYSKGRKNMYMIADIVLSQLMDEICYNVCYNTYSKIDDENAKTADQYRVYSDIVHEENQGLLDFDYEIVNVEKDKTVTDNISNGLLYKLVLIGIITILISFIVMFASNSVIMDKSFSTDKRLNICLVSNFSKVTGDLLSLFFTGEIYVMFASVAVFSRLGLDSLKEKAMIFVAFSLFTLIISIVLMILVFFIKEPVMLQIIGALVICLFGITGAIEIISVAVKPGIRFIANFSPNVHVVRIYNRLTVLGQTNKEFLKFAIFTLIIIFVFYIINFVGDFIKKRRVKG